MKTKTLKLIFTSLLALITLSSCDTSFFEENKIKNPEFDLNLKGLPIGYVTYQAGDLFKNIGSGLENTVNDENVPVFSFSQDLNTIQTADYVDISDINIPIKEVEFKNKNNISSLPGSPSEFTVIDMFPFNQFIGTFENNPAPFAQNVSLNGVDLTYSNFNSGTLTMILSSSYDAKAHIDITIPSIVKKTDKTPFSTAINFDGNGTLTNLEVETININLAEYEIDYTYAVSGNTYSNNQTVNSLVIDANTSVTIAAGDKLRADDVIKYKVDFSNLKPNLIKGDMSGKDFSVADATTKIDLGAFSSFKGLSQLKPKVVLSIENSQGLPLALDLSKVKAVNKTTNEELALSINPGTVGFKDGNKAIVNGGSIDNNNVITSVNTNITLDNSNSNIGQLLDINPSEFVININQAEINPNGETENYFDIDENVKVKLSLEMPLHVKFTDVAFESEFDDFDTIELDDKASSVSLRIETFNAIPLSGTIDLTFMDNAGNIKIFKSLNVIQEAATDGSGNSIYEVTDDNKLRNKNTLAYVNGNVATLSFNADEIQELKKVKKIKSSIFLNSSTDVKMSNTNKLHLKLAMAGDIKISSKS